MARVKSKGASSFRARPDLSGGGDGEEVKVGSVYFFMSQERRERIRLITIMVVIGR